MKVRFYVIAIMMTTLFACKEDTKTAEETTVDGRSQDISPVIPSNPKNLKVPNTCDFITKEWVAERFPVDDLVNFDIKSGKVETDQTNSSSCFYRWSWGDKPNAGFLLQVLTNPVSEDFPSWAIDLVQNKKSGGSGGVGEGDNFKYVDFPGFGDDGAYSEELGQSFWRKGEDYVFMLALNMDLKGKEKFEKGKLIAEKFMQEFDAVMGPI